MIEAVTWIAVTWVLVVCVVWRILTQEEHLTEKMAATICASGCSAEQAVTIALKIQKIVREGEKE